MRRKNMLDAYLFDFLKNENFSVCNDKKAKKERKKKKKLVGLPILLKLPTMCQPDSWVWRAVNVGRHDHRQFQQIRKSAAHSLSSSQTRRKHVRKKTKKNPKTIKP
jgi:hypothetical protein